MEKANAPGPSDGKSQGVIDRCKKRLKDYDDAVKKSARKATLAPSPEKGKD
jgi:hypothetical protein